MTIQSIGKDVRELGLSSPAAGWNVKWYSCFGKQFGSFHMIRAFHF